MAASAHRKTQTQTQTQTKPKRRKQHREITILTSASPSPPRSPAPDQPMVTVPSFPVPTYPPSYASFNSALTAGLLNPMSPPPPLDRTHSSPALFDMMSHEPNLNPNPNPTRSVPIERLLLLQQRIAEILDGDGLFNDQESSDVRLTLTSKDSLTFSLDLHRHVLASNSRFFAARLPDRLSKHHLVEIPDCDDIEIYVETLSLMYCNDLRRRLMKADVGRVLGILKVSAAIAFDAGVVSCLEHLEAAPWAEDEEEKVASLLSQLNLDGAGAGAGEVLKRVSLEVATSSEEAIVTRLIKVVLEGKDEKARREMKGLMAKMLRGNSRGSGDILSEESLYSACNCCIQQLHHHFAGASDASDSAPQISRQADNLHWILDILIDRRIADEFLRIWAAQTELAELHSKVPTLHRYEVSQVTARLFVAIGQGQILVCRETRCLLLRTWLEPFYEDFGWMRRAFKGIDRHSIEDGLGSTILTLPMIMQQEILMDWFHRFLNLGDDCPNIQRGFEVWWRRAFWRRTGEREQLPQLGIAAACDNSY